MPEISFVDAPYRRYIPSLTETAARQGDSSARVCGGLLDQHYGLTLNDTPFADERVIEQHIEAGISLCDAVNFLVEKYALVRTDQPGFSAGVPSQLINSIDILRARRATGLMTRDNYRTVNDITLGRHPEEAKQ